MGNDPNLDLMEIMQAKAFLSSTSDVHLQRKVFQVITKIGAQEPGQRRNYAFVSLPFWGGGIRTSGIDNQLMQSAKRIVGSVEANDLLSIFFLSLFALCFIIFFFFFHFAFRTTTSQVPPPFYGLQLAPHFPSTTEALKVSLSFGLIKKYTLFIDITSVRFLSSKKVSNYCVFYFIISFWCLLPHGIGS